jgi:hypothetical protein
MSVDYVHYESLTPGHSTGSFPDGAWSQRRVFEVPTPGAPNDVSSLPVQLAFNEWMSRNTRTITDPADGDFDDWFEIYNAGNEPVDLGGYSLTDDPLEPRKSVIPPGYVLAPGSVRLVWADGEPEQNAPGRELHVDFALSFEGETLALFSPAGAILDLVNFEPQSRDQSDGLQPDGAVGSVVRSVVPSPGKLNAPPAGEAPRFTAIELDAVQVTLVWATVPGERYQVQYAETLGAGWANLGPPLAAIGTNTRVSDARGAVARFYRVTRI